ncbi:TolC family protein [bacterium]|nr:TolC family protein [bacterium]
MKKLLSFFLILPLTLSLQANQKIPLKKAIQEGIQRNLEYANKLLDEKNAQIRTQKYEAQKRFHIDLNGSYLYQSETMEIEIPSVDIPEGIHFPGRKIQAGVHHSYDLQLSLTQPLYTGGILSNRVELEEIQKAVSANQSLLQKHQIIDEIKSSFFQYQLLIKRKNSLETLRQKLEFHLKQVKNLFQENLVNKNNLIETSSKIKEVNMNIEDIQRTIEKERLHFLRLCGHLPEEIDPGYTEESLKKKKALSYFKKFHPVLRTLDHRIQMAEVSKKITSGKYLPQVSAFAQLHYGKPGIDFFKKEWMLYAKGGVTVNLSVFDWNNLRRDKKILDNRILKLQNQRKKYIRDVTENLDTLYSAKNSLKRKLSEAEDLIDYATEEAQLKKALYEENQLPHIEYLTSLRNKQKYTIQKKEILIQIEQLEVKINTLIGRIKEEL